MDTKIVTTVREIPVFTVGGQEFYSQSDAEQHLESLLARIGRSHYIVHFGFDSTEGRGYFAHEIISVDSAASEQTRRATVIAYCLYTHGAPLTDFYGRPQPTWQFTDPVKFQTVDELDTWIAQTKRSCGGYGHRMSPEIIAIDEWGKPVRSDVLE